MKRRLRVLVLNHLLTLCDPQTSGGLLVCVEKKSASDFEDLMKKNGVDLTPFGKLTMGNPGQIRIHE